MNASPDPRGDTERTADAADAPAYPEALERWWLRRAADAVGARGSEAERWSAMESALAELCAAFTTERAAGLGGYSERPEALAAYGLYYFPQSYARMRRLLAEAGPAPADADAGGPPLRALDLGAGAGAAAAAAAAHWTELAPRRPLEIVAADRAPAALAALRALFDEVGGALWPRARAAVRVADIADPAAAAEGGPWDVMLVSLALNELFEGRPAADAQAWVCALLPRLAPGGRLVVCEPGTPPAARRLQFLRDAIAADGRWTIRAPCPHGAPCPMRSDPRAWCHDVRRWPPPPAARRINRRLRLPLHLLRHSLLIVENAPAPRPPAGAAPTPARLVAPPFETAGRVVFRGCAATGALETYETLTRGLDRAARARLAGLERGDVVAWDLERRLGDGRWRARPRQR